MWPDRESNPGHLTYESGALTTALRGPADDVNCFGLLRKGWTLSTFGIIYLSKIAEKPKNKTGKSDIQMFFQNSKLSIRVILWPVKTNASVYVVFSTNPLIRNYSIIDRSKMDILTSNWRHRGVLSTIDG